MLSGRRLSDCVKSSHVFFLTTLSQRDGVRTQAHQLSDLNEPDRNQGSIHGTNNLERGGGTLLFQTDRLP